MHWTRGSQEEVKQYNDSTNECGLMNSITMKIKVMRPIGLWWYKTIKSL